MPLVVPNLTDILFGRSFVQVFEDAFPVDRAMREIFTFITGSDAGVGSVSYLVLGGV